MPKHSASRRMMRLKRPRSSGVKVLESATPSMGLRGLKMTAAATTGPARGPRPASSMPATRLILSRLLKGLAGTQQGEDRLRGARTGAQPQLRVDTRELPLQGAAPLSIVKPHQKLCSDRRRDNLFLKILADDAPIRK